MEPFITCENAKLTTHQLFRMLLVDVDGVPAMRVVGLDGGGTGPGTPSGPKVADFVATANQTNFTLPSTPVNDYILFKDGAYKQLGHSINGSVVTMDSPQQAGTEISIIF